MKKLYYNMIIAFKVWLASINPNTFEYAIDYRHEHWILDDYKQRLQWHYFGMPQYVKDDFYYKAMWERIKEKAHDEWLKSIFTSLPLPQSVMENIKKAQEELGGI